MKNYDLDLEDLTRSVKFNKFKAIESDWDETISERSFTGRLTKARYKFLDRFCRAHSGGQRCHHDYDCCGCLFRVDYSFTYKANEVVVRCEMQYNY